MKRFLASAAAIALLTGCSGSAEPETQTIYRDSPLDDDMQAPEPYVEPQPELTDEEIGKLAMEMTWNDMPQTDRDMICIGWNNPDMQDLLLSEYQSSSGYIMSDQQVKAFFDGKC